MLVVTQESAVPPGGFFVAKCPQSGVVFRRHTVDGVWSLYNEHCRANGYPELSRQEVVENICANTNSNICQDDTSPTFGQMVVNVFHDALEWAKAGFPASQAAVDARLPICQACPYWRGGTGGSYFSIACGKCGCSGLKLAMHSTRCPLGNWEAFTP